MDLQKEFFDKLRNYKVISIIGLAKNVSKTTTLNHIIKNLKGPNTIGLTSIGRDGEKYDVLTNLPKPRIFIRKGTYVATAQKSLENSEVSMKLIKDTGINTPMGEVKILIALNSGYVELAGPSVNSSLSKVCDDLLNLGCDLILVDGAFDRKSYATPLISDATILSTGASVSKSIESVVDLTAYIVRVLTLENEINEEILKKANEIFKNSKIGIINSKNSMILLDSLTALDAAKDIIDKLTTNSKYVVIKGAITDKLLIDLMKTTNKYKGITFLAEDSTKLFLSKKIFEKFQKKGGFIKVLNPINVIAITANPTSPSGYYFNKKEFLKLLKENIDLPIYDLGSYD